MKKYLLLFILSISALVYTSCEEEVEPQNTNYVTFAAQDFMTGIDVGSTASVDVNIYTANTTGSERTFALAVDASGAPAGSYTVPSSVSIPANSNEGTLTVQLADVDLGIGVSSLVISLVGEAGLSVGEPVTISYMQNCSEVSATLDIVFDGYGSETTWEITDALGGVVVSGGPYADGQATASESFSLCSGRDYTFYIYDSYGDGLTYPGLGSYELKVGGSSKVAGDGNYGTGTSAAFDTN
jgi:hypothetical protein